MDFITGPHACASTHMLASHPRKTMSRSKSTSIAKPVAVERAMNTLLEKVYWPSTLGPGAYSRTHDDTDGKRGAHQQLHLMIGPDGDCWVASGDGNTLRFRTHAGGTASPRVQKALLVLAEAIRRDNEERPRD